MAKSVPLLIMITFLAIASSDVPAEASHTITGIYTLPFTDSTFVKTCGFGCYAGHKGTDYQLGNFGAPGEDVVSALGGTIKHETDGTPGGAGKFVTIDHHNGNITRYLHLQDFVGANGATVYRGDIIAHEGNTGSPWCQDPPACTDYASPYHLHFETKIHATPGVYTSGTAVDPYDPANYLWTAPESSGDPAYPAPPLWSIKKSGGGTNSTEVHIQTFDGYETWSFEHQKGTALPETKSNFEIAIADWTGDGRGDRNRISRRALDSVEK